MEGFLQNNLHDLNIAVNNLCIPGVALTDSGVNALKRKIRGFTFKNGDVILLEVLSNSILKENGDKIQPTTINRKTTYHYSKPFIIDETCFNTCMRRMQFLLEEVPEYVAIILLPPFPRYLSKPCCGNNTHMKNISILSKSFLGKAEFFFKLEINLLKKKYRCVRGVQYSEICGHNVKHDNARKWFESQLNTDSVHYKASSFEHWLKPIRNCFQQIKIDIENSNKRLFSEQNRNFQVRNNNCGNSSQANTEITRLRKDLEKEKNLRRKLESRCDSLERECKRLRTERDQAKNNASDYSKSKPHPVFQGCQVTINY